MEAASHAQFSRAAVITTTGGPAMFPAGGPAPGRQSSLVRFLFFDRPLGRRQGLEALIRDRLGRFRRRGRTFRRRDALRRARARQGLRAGPPRDSRRTRPGRGRFPDSRDRPRPSNLRVLVGALRKRTLDPLALRDQQLTCPLRIHRTSLLQVVLDDGLVTRLSCVRVEPLLFQGAPLAQEIPASVE